MAMKQRFFGGAGVAALIAGFALSGTAVAQDAPIIQPGAPGQDNRQLSEEEAARLAINAYSEADVAFVQNLLAYRAQVTELTGLVDGRTEAEGIIEIAERINEAQPEELTFLRDWLTERDEPLAAESLDDDDEEMMEGLSSPAQITTLSNASGTDFDTLFLELMIDQHDGLVDMVDGYLRTRGTAFDPALFEFANTIRREQRDEIETMNEIFAGLSDDPRRGLGAGYLDAESAISNLRLVSTQPKPTGFFDPENPVGLPPEIVDEDAEADEDTDPRFGTRSPYLRFSNTDFAFAGNLMAVGNYHGFNLYDISEATPRLMTSVVCPGGQGDVSIEGDFLIMSVQDTRGRIDCGRQGVDEEVSDERFRGIRIFDISDPLAPRQVGLVQTCRGSHTHTVVSRDDESIIVYNSGTSSVRPEEELAGCVAGLPGDEDTALFSIDVIEIPIANPAASRIIDSPRVFADPETGAAAGLWSGGDHGEGTQSTRRTDQCHDITIFPALNIAAGACSGNGIIFDITDPRTPTRIDDVVDVGFAYWHSATFNNDGTKVVFTDEWGGGGGPRCRPQDPNDWGANAIFELEDGELTFASYYKIPNVQSDHENCVAHNGNIIPVPGRDIFVQAWYQGGMSLMDFTDADNPYEIGFFDRGPLATETYVTGGYWSTYWYNGRIYGTAQVRGLDVFELEPSEFMTANEIEAAQLADMGEIFNPQTQTVVTWPTHPAVALAYVDQMVREGSMSETDAAVFADTLTRARTHMEAGTSDRQLAGEIRRLRRDLPRSDRGEALREQLTDIAAEVR
ncbi:DUF305 domain-containing protein [Maricaulaceae bacterium EIL42A08]|nr:DUF305 domain-containing protein [Maricaulaceae bacterium EIL42A08]